MVETALFYVVAGRRRTIHRGVSVDGVDHVATERCNLDDTEFPARRVEAPTEEDAERICRWCFPKGVTE